MAEAIAKKKMTIKAAAEWHGVSERTIRRRISEGKLPAYRIGPRTIRVSPEDVAALAKLIPTADQAS